MEIKDKVVLVTGSSLGIGRATVEELAKEKAIPIVTYYKDREEGESLAKKLNTKAYYLNLMDDSSIREVLDLAFKDFGGVDVLINNAGVIHWKSFREQSFKEIEEQIRVNLEGLIKMTKAFIEKNPNYDLIVNIASGASKTAYPTLSVYCATKFGVRAFSLALMEEGERVKIVNPRSTKTRMTGFRGDDPRDVAKIIVKGIKGEIKEKEIDVWNYL